MSDPPQLPDDRNPHPQIQQDLKGDRNQGIGQAIDSTIVNFAGDGQVINLTINDRIPPASLPPSNIVVQNLTQQEYRQRQVLLNKVKDAWVKGVLEKSLHARVSIELGLQERPDLVQQAFSDVAEFAAAPGQALPEGTPATTVFDRMGSGRTLLIVGEPGSGKTIALLKLAEDLIVRTETDLQQPIPVVFNLSSWARKPQTIEKWLVQQLLEKYQVSKALGNALLKSESLILLLDGLDEVKVEQRNACIQALNQFIQAHGTTELTICCRIQDYQALTEQLILRSAICIQPLTPIQINHYLDQAGEQLIALKTLLEQDTELQMFVSSPLILSIMSLAYEASSFTEVSQMCAGGNRYRTLFDTYTKRMLERKHGLNADTTQIHKRLYSQEQIIRWLVYLAKRMTNTSQTIFLIERMQPNWLQTKLEKYFYSASIGLTCILLGIFLAIGLTRASNLFLGSGMVFIGLIFGLISWGILEITFGSKNIQPVESLKWSWVEFRKNFSIGLIFIPICVVIFVLIYALFEDWLYPLNLIAIFNGIQSGFATKQVYFGMIAGSTLTVVFSLIRGFTGSGIGKFTFPNQGMWLSAQNSSISSLVGVFGLGIASELVWRILHIRWNFIEWATTGLIFGLAAGGSEACIKHLILRLVLYCHGYIPRNYAHFLNYAADRLFLQKVGSGYIFVHRMLLEHFAEMSLEQEKR